MLCCILTQTANALEAIHQVRKFPHVGGAVSLQCLQRIPGRFRKIRSALDRQEIICKVQAIPLHFDFGLERLKDRFLKLLAGRRGDIVFSSLPRRDVSQQTHRPSCMLGGLIAVNDAK